MNEIFKKIKQRIEGRGDWPRRKEPKKEKEKKTYENEHEGCFLNFLKL